MPSHGAAGSEARITTATTRTTATWEGEEKQQQQAVATAAILKIIQVFQMWWAESAMAASALARVRERAGNSTHHALFLSLSSGIHSACAVLRRTASDDGPKWTVFEN